MIVYVKEVGVLGVTISTFSMGYVVKYYLDGIEFTEFLLEDEYIVYERGKIGGMDVI